MSTLNIGKRYKIFGIPSTILLNDYNHRILVILDPFPCWMLMIAFNLQ